MEHLHSIIIVDDEAIIREGLSDMVDWKQLGYEVAGSFSDGRDAIDYLANHDVDVILTDLKMDDLGGIEVARYAHEHRPGTRTVILSGHRDFAFARDAIRFRATNYLLKPIDFDELQSVFAELKRELATLGQMESPMGPSPQQIVSDIVASRIGTRDDLARHVGALGLGLDIDSSPAAIVLIDFQTMRAGNQTSTVRDGIVATIRRQCALSLFEPAVTLNDKIVLLAVDRELRGAEALATVIRDRLDDAVESIRSAFQLPIVASILACKDGLGELVASNPAIVVQQALSEHRKLDLPERSAADVPFLRRVIDYLDENYATDMSLADASALAYLSPVYFGRLFRERVGVTFTEYLASVRIRKAIELLREQRYKVYEVGERVGYANPRYFARVFRKATGYSPKEYCREVLARELTE